jgi:hypothetical protein
LTSGRRDIEAEILRQRIGTDLYGQPNSEWASLASIWVAEDVSAGNSRVSDRNQPTFAAEFTALEIDCRHVKASDMLRVYYADYQIDAIVRIPGSRGEVALTCSATKTVQIVPGAVTPMLHEASDEMHLENVTPMLYEDGSTPAIDANHQ